MSTLRLLPNLGDEEAGGWQRALRLPRVAAAARLWRFLFPADARLLGPDDGATPNGGDWPEALRPQPARSALPDLDALSGCVPWLASPAAHEAARAAGLDLSGPEAATVRRVNDKAFAFRAAEAAGFIPRELRGTTQPLEPADLEDASAVAARIESSIAAWPTWARAHPVLKPRLGTSGRGRLESQGGRFSLDSLARALPRLREQGGALLEPWLQREKDFSVQLYVRPDGGLVLWGSLEMRNSPAGGFVGHRGEVDSRGRIFSGDAHDEALREAAAALASAAASEGFHGPAGVDAFSFRIGVPARDENGVELHDRNRGGVRDPGRDAARTLLRPIVELNARFTMGTVTLGLVRRVLPAVRRALHLEPGDRRAFWFCLDRTRADWEAAREAAGAGALWLPLWRDGDPVRPALLFAQDATRLDRALAARS